MRDEVRERTPWTQAPRDDESKGGQAPGWMVGFFDALGDQSIFRSLAEGSLGSNPHGLGRRVELIARRIAGRRQLRDQLESLVRCNAAQPGAHAKRTVHPELDTYADAWRRVQVIKQVGSHWTLAVSLEPAAGYLPLPAAHHLLTCASAAMLIQLATGAREPEIAPPLRGAIALERDVKQEKDLQRSSGMQRAQQLERERARYPRAVICKDLVRQLTSSHREGPDGPAGAYATRLEALLPGLWFEDEDGETVLDFFGPVVRDAMEDGSGKCHALAYNAWSHVTQGLRSDRCFTDPTVRRKYEWLADYMRPRLSVWGVAA